MVHEKYLDATLAAAKKYKDNPKVEGLLFKYLHFYGTYDYVGDTRRWYDREIRIIRNNAAIHSYRDAQGFRIDGRKLNVKPIDAFIYHYGWVKHPEQQQHKREKFEMLWNEEQQSQEKNHPENFFDYTININTHNYPI